MDFRLSDDKVSQVFHRALSQSGLVTEEDTSVIFYDLSFMEERIKDLVALFPPTTLHAVAVKANPLVRVLKLIENLNIGLETASLPELYLAIKAGFSPKKIVFDSPVKTVADLEFAITQGVHINADSLRELEKIDDLIKQHLSSVTIGIRINPQVGTGRIDITSTAGEYSKFGVPITDNREKLIECFLEYEWLRGVHMHIGSQGCPVKMLLDGAKIMVEFINEANAVLRDKGLNRQIDIFDLGGGLPVSYHRDKAPVSMTEYRDKLIPILDNLDGEDFKFITEFGRYIHANTGWVASRVECVKREPNINTAMIHVGADLFLRECYRPDLWHHEIQVVDHNGKIKTGKDDHKYVLAGPLCFSGDMIARDIALPRVEEGDYILIHDAGAYTLSMWSRYNSRQIPKVVGYHDDGDTFDILRKREQPDDLWKFWS